MSIAQYLKEIGRGKEGARSLKREQAHDLMCQLLDGKCSDLETGAFALAMRIKGESVAELMGFLQAAEERSLPIPVQAPMVVLPSYNGARRLPNLTALVALLLAQEGVNVLVHGPGIDPGRVTTAEIFRHLGLTCARDALEVGHAWARHEPVFMHTDVWCAPLARLLDVRRVVGLRNSGHTVAKLLAPSGAGVMRVINHTHPEYALLTASFVTQARMDALVLRGTEGEPVADPRRRPRLDIYLHGLSDPTLSVPAHEGILTELPVLPQECDAASTANYIQSVVSGEKPAPGPLMAQVGCLVGALAAQRRRAGLGQSA